MPAVAAVTPTPPTWWAGGLPTLPPWTGERNKKSKLGSPERCHPKERKPKGCHDDGA